MCASAAAQRGARSGAAPPRNRRCSALATVAVTAPGTSATSRRRAAPLRRAARRPRAGYFQGVWRSGSRGAAVVARPRGGARLLLERAPAAAAARGPVGAGSALGTTLALFAAILVLYSWLVFSSWHSHTGGFR